MKGYMILADIYFKKSVDETKKEELFAQIKELSANPTPENRYQIAQLVGFSVMNILNTRLNFLEQVADVKSGANGDKPEWKIPYSGVVAKVAAKGSTPEVSKISQKRVVVPTVEVHARPKVDFQDLVQRPEQIMRIIEEAADRMENEMVQYIETTNYAVFSALSSPNYASAAGIDKTKFDALLGMVQRFGQASIVGDFTALTKLTALTGFNSNVADALAIEHNNNRFLGTYLGANTVSLTNRYADESSLATSNLVLRNDLIYIVPTGDVESRPLKVFLEGALRTMDRTNPEDESYEIFMRMDFGVAVIGNQRRSAVYEDTAL